MDIFKFNKRTEVTQITTIWKTTHSCYFYKITKEESKSIKFEAEDMEDIAEFVQNTTRRQALTKKIVNHLNARDIFAKNLEMGRIRSGSPHFPDLSAVRESDRIGETERGREVVVQRRISLHDTNKEIR